MSGERPDFTKEDAAELAELAENSPTCFDFLDALRARCKRREAERTLCAHSPNELSMEDVFSLLGEREVIVKKALGDKYDQSDEGRVIHAAAINAHVAIEMLLISNKLHDGFINFPTHACATIIERSFDDQHNYPLFRDNFEQCFFDMYIKGDSLAFADSLQKILKCFCFHQPMTPSEAACAFEIIQHLPFDLEELPHHPIFEETVSNVLIHADELAEDQVPFQFSPRGMSRLMPKFAWDGLFPEAWLCEWINDPGGEYLLWHEWNRSYYTREEGAQLIEKMALDILRRNWFNNTREVVSCFVAIHLFRVIQAYGQLSDVEASLCELCHSKELCEAPASQELFLRILRFCGGEGTEPSDIASMKHLECALTELGVDTGFLQIDRGRAQTIANSLLSRDAGQALREYCAGILDLRTRDVSDTKSILSFQGILQRLSVAFEKEALSRAAAVSTLGSSEAFVKLDDAISAIEGYCILKHPAKNVAMLRIAQRIRNDNAHNVIQFSPIRQADLENQLLRALEWLVDFDDIEGGEID